MIYKTSVLKKDHINGMLEFSDNDSLQTQHPLTDNPGYNPEQLVGSAWATCLNATIQTILQEKNITLPSSVRVDVELCKEADQSGYYFQVDAYASIPALPSQEALQLLESAHKRCPVSKLLQGAKTVQLHLDSTPQ